MKFVKESIEDVLKPKSSEEVELATQELTKNTIEAFEWVEEQIELLKEKDPDLLPEKDIKEIRRMINGK